MPPTVSHGHPEPAEEAYPFTDAEIQQVDYLLWSHGADTALRARVKAELQQREPPAWAVDPEDPNPGPDDITEEDMQELYGLLADATEAASTGDPNTCASKAADAKQLVLDLSER